MKKTLIFTALLLPLLLGGAGVAQSVSTANAEENTATYTEADRDVATGYLLRDSFIVYQQAAEGWETLNMPHGVNVCLGDVKSSNTTLPTYIKKNFVSQTGEVVTDIVFSLASDISRGYLSILGHKAGKEVKAVLLLVENNVVKYVDYNGTTYPLITLDYENSVGIKIIANAGLNTASVEVNGAPIAAVTNLTLSDEVTDLCGVKIGFDKTDTGGFKMKDICVRKGYIAYEDFTTVGYVNQVSTDHDFNQETGVFVNATVNDHSIQGDNNNLAPLAFDNDDSTYWEHNTQYAITKNVYFMVNYPSTISADTMKLKFASYYKGYIEISVCSPSGSWSGLSSQYRYFRFETTKENNYTCDIEIDEPRSMTILAIGFTVGDGGYDIPGGEIKLATFNCWCKHPKEVTINTYPQAWQKEENKNTSVAIASVSGDKALRLTNNNGLKNCSTYLPIECSGDITTEFTVSYNDDKNGNRIGLVNSANNFFGIETKDGKMNFVQEVSGDVAYTPIVNAEQQLKAINVGLWQRFILKYDSAKNTVNVDFNGWCPIEDVTLNAAFKNSTFIKFYACTGKSKTMFTFDSVQIYKTLPLSNVPDIVPCSTGDVIVTMQVCSLWREGTHTGWGILDNPELCGNEPILGYYDEGTAAVADWEVKIAKEHGISNFMFCWYRNNNSTIKTSRYSDAIWDGLFKSKFRDEINFSIMLENSGSTVINGYSDLRDNITPYFIETFFKNPNYQKTKDGKPILYVYIPDLQASIGDANEDGVVNELDVKFALENMKQACVDAGLPGLYISAETRVPSSTTARKIESFGYDSIFSYTWASGYYNVSDDQTLAYSRNAIMSQVGALSTMRIIPTLSKQWDPSPWMNCGFNSEGAIYKYDLEHYRQFALWIKDYAANNAIDEAGTKMIMLDNWNEYSEGHWLMPSYNTPGYKGGRMAYGFLDLLKEVYGIGEYTHIDYFPREDGFGVYDTWYPYSWDEPLSKYLELYGEPIDNSVVESEIIDWEIGYDTCGGSTAYVSAYGTNTLEVLSANRVFINADVVAAIKASGNDLVIKGMYGTVSIKGSDLAALNANKSLEVVLNRVNNSTEAAALLRNGDIDFGYIMEIEYSLKQDGYLLDINATLSITGAEKFASTFIKVDGELKLTSEQPLIVCGCGDIVFITL